MTPLPTQNLGHNIFCIDTAYTRPGLAACYLMVHQGKAAFIDSGTYYSVPGLLQTLEQQQLSPADVAYIIPTHVHLDHAGGAGELMRHCPNARMVVHPRGATHMIDPSRLKAGAMAVYGEASFRSELGDLVATPEERVTIADDGLCIDLNGRKLVMLDTPGHASHHLCVYDVDSQGFFTGDTFGVAYPELASPAGAYIFPPTTPVQFKPEAWLQSIDRLLSYKPQRMYLTHYGMVTKIAPLAADLKRRIREFAALARSHSQDDDPTEPLKQALSDQMTAAVQQGGSQLPVDEIHRLLALDIDLNAQGLAVWLKRSH